ncbi:hypothetical protein [Mycobacterium kansasii]|uniref:hypothetical protein n=1 Tax=Mycobacterium kansasii TaxID=1768 RepID=UPI003A8378DE
MAKSAHDVVKGMLSSAGQATRAADQPDPQASSPPATHATVSLSAAPAQVEPIVDRDVVGEAPRTLRLRPQTAARLRAAWMEAKRDDVFLTAQDFASKLLDEALLTRRRRGTTSTR